MRRLIPSAFSFTPLTALIPGLLLLAAFAGDGAVTGGEALLGGVALIVGAAWAGLREAPTRPEVVTHVDTSLASTILNALPDPVVLLDSRRRVLAANTAAGDLLGDGIRERDVCLTLRHPDAQRAIKAVVDGGRAKDAAEVVFDAPLRRVYQLQVMTVPGGAGHAVRAVVAMHEVTALKRAEAMHAEFVANASHELRSPLATMTGFIETLQTTARDDEPARERFLGIMGDEAARMSRLIDDLLSLSRIEVNEHVRPKGRVRLAQVIADVRAAVQMEADRKGMAIAVELPENLPDVLGDADELREVFQNLVENALKYGAAGTPVTVGGRGLEWFPETGGPGVEVSVRDRGEGIAAEHLPRLTERFYRIDKGRSRALGGTGLGLAIVKHIVNRHRGRLNVESTLGQGSVFHVQLPVFKDETN